MNARVIFSTPTCALASLCVLLALCGTPARADDTATPAPPSTVKSAPKAAAKAKAVAQKKATAPVELVPTAATDEQRSAAERVYYGEYQCDFKQVVHITASDKHPAYVDLRFANASYLMKPVLSSTGAIRLEDVRGQTLMIQIARKSMLMNVKTGTRLVDDCISARQRAEIEAAQQAAALEAANAVAKPAP